MVECPNCHTSNPPGSLSCAKCNTPIELDGATIALDRVPGGAEGETILDPTPRAASDPNATVLSGPTGWSDPAQSTSPDPAAPLQAGMVLGERYEILKPLGEGGMGAVYKARDRELDRLVALKVIRPELAGHPEILRRFKQELILARQVTHKNVIRIFDLGMADGRKFITMEFVEGRDLKSILVERGKLPAEEVVPIVQQICRGLEAAHTEGVVHRDLKPQNIMVDAQGRVWVMDFGLARSTELVGMTRTGSLMGTPDYMSPEQARADKVDARADLFSLGIIFYETLTGDLPFPADTLMAALLKRVKEKAVPPSVVDPSIPQRVSDIVMKCLEADRDKRYQTCGEILADLAGEAPHSSASIAQPSTISVAALGPGSQFGPRYKIESLIGEGGMGKVYKAHDSDLDRTVALKLVRPELASDPNAMQRFKQELLLASRISHKNILRIHDLGDVGGVKFISMAYVEGKDLHDVIAECGRFPVERAVNIARQLAGALEAAHTEGVVHRDLKPRNVLVDRADNVYVSDFGLAKSLESDAATVMTRTGEVLGTPRYMSPEQAESKPTDHRSDLYSLGVILYEMVTGDAPFAGDSTLQVMYQHVTQRAKDPKLVNPELPDYLNRIILKCLEKNPADRYQHAREIQQDLESARPPARVVRLRLAEVGYPKWFFALLSLAVLAGLSLLIRPIRDLIMGRSSIAITRSSGPAKFLAVLPFRVIGNDPALKYEAEGIVDALSAKLFQLKNVHLASPAAVEKVKLDDSVKKIARELGVKLVVEGTIQGAGDRINVVLSLNDESGRLQWTKEFPGMRQDLLVFQNDVYKGLLDALDLKPTSEEFARTATRLTENSSAYEDYLKGRNLFHTRRDLKAANIAVGLYQQAVRKDSRFALAYAGLADAYLYIFDAKKDSSWVQKAVSAAQQAQALNDDLSEVHISLGSSYVASGKNAEAALEFKRALELAPNSDDVYRRLANVYLISNQPDEALQAYQKAIEVSPFYWLNFDHLGHAYYQLGQNEKALEAYQRVTELAPDKADGFANMGEVYYRMGKWDQAIASLQKAISLEPNSESYSNIGVAYFYQGKYAEAAKMFEKAVEMTPNNDLLVCNLADTYRALGQKDKATAAYDRAIKLAYNAYQVNPRRAGTLGSLGLYNAKKGDLNRARNFIAQARSIDPNDSELIYDEAVISALGGRQDEALKSLREALQKGYPVREARNDPDLASLRASAEFAKLTQESTNKPK
jgi:serine/threonine protein kinase/tetratricopeptide (TPR) repeat protein